MMIPATTNTVGIRHKPRTTKDQRLRALLLAEKEERRLFASQYAQNLPKQHYKTAYPNRITDNPYYKYFHSQEGDEVTAQSLLPDVFTERLEAERSKQMLASAQQQQQLQLGGSVSEPGKARGGRGGSGKGGADEQQASSSSSVLPKLDGSSSVANPLLTSGSASNLLTSASIVEKDDLTYTPGLRKKGALTPSQQQAKKRKLKKHKEVKVDITALKPQSAEFYVKCEKLYRLMLAEDKEFVAFRKDYLRRMRDIEIENALTSN